MLKPSLILIQPLYIHIIDPFHKSHNASYIYTIMHHFVTEMCTHVHIFVTKWCIVGDRTGALWDFVRWVYWEASSICLCATDYKSTCVAALWMWSTLYHHMSQYLTVLNHLQSQCWLYGLLHLKFHWLFPKIFSFIKYISKGLMEPHEFQGLAVLQV